jgi:hypothetical protein
MKGSKSLNFRRVLALAALLFGSTVTMLQLPAYGQECDQTWYNPWAESSATATQPAQPQAGHKHQAKVKAVSASQRASKVRAKSATAQTRPS